MKATLTEEPTIYTIEVNGHKVKGMRVDGELGPVRLLKNDKGEKIYIYDGGSTFASAFRRFVDITGESDPREISLIAATPSLLDTFNPPAAAAPAAAE